MSFMAPISKVAFLCYKDKMKRYALSTKTKISCCCCRRRRRQKQQQPKDLSSNNLTFVSLSKHHRGELNVLEKWPK